MKVKLKIEARILEKRAEKSATRCRQNSDVGLKDDDFKAAFLNRFKELKETTLKRLKESMMAMIKQIENFNK